MTHTRYVWYVLLFTIFLPNLLHAQVRGEEKVVFDFDCPTISVQNITGMLSTTLAKNRTKIGVGEKIRLVSTKGVKWEILSGNQNDAKLTIKNTLQAEYESSIIEGIVVIRATPIDGSSCQIVDTPINVIAPEEVSVTKICGYHEKDVYEVGLVTDINYVLPNTVSFEKLSVKEEDSPVSANGGLSMLNNTKHVANQEWAACYPIVTNDGTTFFGFKDDAYWGFDVGVIPNPLNGKYSTEIPWSYAKTVDTSKSYKMAKTVSQEGELDGVNLISRKKNIEHKVLLGMRIK